MFCSKCGTQFQENDVICNTCGSGKKAIAPVQPSVQPYRVNAQATHLQANRPRGIPVVVRILLSLLIVAVVLIVLSATGVWCIGETLGFTQDCVTPRCNGSSRLFDDLCSRCRDAVDNVRDFFR